MLSLLEAHLKSKGLLASIHCGRALLEEATKKPQDLKMST